MNSGHPGMNGFRFIKNNLLYYWKKNALLAAGVAISTAVVTGSLIVGDSVSFSLNRIVEERLGQVTHILTAGDRYFTDDLAERTGAQLNIPVSSLLLEEGMASAGGGQKRINRVQVLGVDRHFDSMAGVEGYFGELSGDTVIISRNLANRLDVNAGDEILLRIEKASLIPRNAPFVSDAESVVSARVIIAGVAGDDRMGRFNLRISQTAPFNVFMARSRLEQIMEFTGMSNVILFRAGEGLGPEDILAAVRDRFSVADAGLSMEIIREQNQIGITSDRVFIDDVLAGPLTRSDGSGRAILTYFANRIESGRGSAPYSFISTLPSGWLHQDEIVINEWLAADLDADVGDTVGIRYFVVGPLRELSEESESFRVKAVVPMEGMFGDRSLMPHLPGLSDAGNCRDWETGVPIDLESIRDKDEDYWDQYGGIPKAFISISRAEQLWKNRFGTYTAFRYDLGSFSLDSLEESLLKDIDPSLLGFTLESARLKGYEAAGSGVDFSQLFGGLSFFLLVAGVLLTILLFLLNLQSREGQLRTLVVMGIPVKIIRRLTMLESMLVGLAGSAAGLVLAVVYNHMVFRALNGVWRDVVRTEMMQIHIRGETLLSGLVITLAICFFALLVPLNRILGRQVRAHRPSRMQSSGRLPGRRDAGLRRRQALALAYLASGIVALGLIGSQLVRMEVVNVPVFFAAGGLLLLSVIFFILWYLVRLENRSVSNLDLPVLSWKNALRNRTRSMSIVILFAIGAFLVISTGSNRKDLFRNATDPSSGTGGYLYYAESTLPALQNLNDPGVRFDLGLDGSYSLVQMRKATGDDASCLNLNKIITPRVLGVDPGQLEGRFSFVTGTDLLDQENPWMSLGQELEGGLIPAIADETVIKWGLGLKVGDTLRYVNSNGGSMELLLIGGLAPSIFQGNVIISGEKFLEQFPESSGTHVFLVEGTQADSAMIRSELERGMRDLGWDMQLSASRLTEFNSVTNTYLSIFLVMGALGLLLGTFGLVVVLSRSILERKQEIALLRALGYGHKKIRQLVVREYLILLLAGIGTGFLAAIVATLPSILSAHTGTSFLSILAWLTVLVANGWIWIVIITRTSLKGSTIYTALRNE